MDKKGPVIVETVHETRDRPPCFKLACYSITILIFLEPEQYFPGLEINSFRRNLDGPNIVEITQRIRYILKQRNCPHLPDAVRCQVAKIADGSVVNEAIFVLDNSTNCHCAIVRNRDLFPGDAIVLENITLVTDID